MARAAGADEKTSFVRAIVIVAFQCTTAVRRDDGLMIGVFGVTMEVAVEHCLQIVFAKTFQQRVCVQRLLFYAVRQREMRK